MWLKERVDEHSRDITELKGDFKVVRAAQEAAQKMQASNHSATMEAIGGLHTTVSQLQDSVLHEKLDAAYRKGQTEGAATSTKWVIGVGLTVMGMVLATVFNLLRAG